MSAIYPDLEGRGVLITGGASGIGEALVEAFWAQGARVAILDRDAGALDVLLTRLKASSASTSTPLGAPRLAPVGAYVDLVDVSATQRAIEQLGEAVGGYRVLINNAGWDQRHEFEETTPEFWDRCQAINLRPHFFTAQAVRGEMMSGGGGSIINMSSNSYLLKVSGMPSYLTAKAGIIGLTRALARELGPHKIRVNALLPGWVMTDRQVDLWLTPEAEEALIKEQCLKEKIYPTDIADLALFLGSDASRMITAQSYILDAGRA